jgi:plasmid maintenance system antidote protein VapI
MTKEQFARRVIKCTYQHWYYVLRGEKNLGYRKAVIVARLLNTAPELWINPDADANDRRNAWNKYIGEKP